MKIPALLVWSVLPVAGLHAQEGNGAAPAPAPAVEAKPTSDDLRKKLTATATEELEAYNKTPGNHPYSLESYFSVLERQSPETFRSVSSDADYLITTFPGGPGFAKSKELAKAYVELLKTESTELRRKYEAECATSLAALVKRAVGTQDPEKLGPMGEELDDFYRKVAHSARRFDDEGGYRIPDISADQSNLRNFISQIYRFHSQRVEEQWSGAAGTLQDLRKQAAKLSRYLTADEAKAFIANCEKSIGMLTPDEMQRLFDSTVAELFDDANQDRMDAIIGTIRKQYDLSRNGVRQGMALKWQSLSEMASGFSQNLTRMKQGNPPQFSPEQWLRANSEASSVIGREKLVGFLKRYRVRVPDGSGGVRQEPLYYDMDEVIARIQSPADIARELPVFNKAVKQASYSSDGGVNWQGLGQRLQQYADLFAKLESGLSFSLGSYNGSEYGYERSASSGGDDAAAKKAADLNQQLQWMIVQRFHPEVTSDPQSTPARAVADLFAQAKNKADYQKILNLGKLSAYLTPGQGLLGSQDASAIQFYLNGVKQEEELDQPRLATYYFQRAAAIPNSPIPSSVFKARLKTLKRNSPKDYDKGTDDALGGNIDASSPILQGALVVPAKPTP